jgi:hypothetical protein
MVSECKVMLDDIYLSRKQGTYPIMYMVNYFDASQDFKPYTRLSNSFLCSFYLWS